MTRLTAILVTHNSVEHLRPCLQAASQYLPADAAIVVVDNASSDQSVAVAQEYGERVTVISNQENEGFAAACNRGARHVPAEAYFLLNPDVELRSPVTDLLAAAAQPGYAGASGQLVGTDGQTQAGFTVRSLPTATALILENLGINRLWPGNPSNRRWRLSGLDLTVPQDVEQPAGAFLLIRGSVWRELGGMDEGFRPVWFEDVDLCARLRQTGWKLRYVPSVVGVHAGGHSVKKLSPLSRQAYWYASLLRYSVLHFQPLARNGIRLSVLWATLLRGLVALLLGPSSPQGGRFGALTPLWSVGKLIGAQLLSESRERRQTPGFSGEARTAVK